jgi:malonyl-CoA/methylmalonyl-CoA synthetase
MTNALYDALFAPHAHSTKPFLICDDGRVVTYAAFVQRAAQIAHVLTAAGVGPGDRVLVQAPKQADTLALYAATLQAGAVYLPLNTAYTQSECAYFIEDAEPKAVICDVQNEDVMSEITQDLEAVLFTVGEPAGSLSRQANLQPTTFDTTSRSETDLAALLYTSGTTGRSKGAMLTQTNLLSNAQTLIDHWQITSDDRLIHALPIFHTHGLFVALNTALLVRATVRLMDRFDVDDVLDELPKSTLLMGVPTFYTRLVESRRLNRDLAQNMRLFISGSAPLLADTHAMFEARTGHAILERYGMTETNMVLSNPYHGARVPGTVGYPLPGIEVKLTDAETGAAVPPGEIGVIDVRGDNVFQGYWNMPEKTAEELKEDGFFITGDLAVEEADGRITIVGRAKDLIISGGYNIYPKEVEDVLNAVPGVLESAVFGSPHPDFGESVVAAIVMEDDSEEDIDALKAAADTHLARFKHPKRYVFLPALPRNAMGKVQKNILRAEHSANRA